MKAHRILWVISGLSAGGAERVIAELANAFADRGHSVAVLTLTISDNDHYNLSESVKRISLDTTWASHSFVKKISSNVRRNSMIRSAVREYKPDVVISFIEETNIRVLMALLRLELPVIVSERTDPRRHRVHLFWKIARRLLYPTAARVVVQTESVAVWARRFLHEKQVRVVPNFVRILPPSIDDNLREDKSILAVGRFDSHKGFDVLLRAFALCGWAERGVKLTLLGDGPERKALSFLAQELGISDKVDMPGVVKDPERWMSCASVFVLPSRYEGFPNVLLEAMAMGCPVIASDCDSGPREIIQSNKNGLLVSVGDVEELSIALQSLLSNPNLRRRLGTEAVKVRERYSRTTILEQWEKLIEEVINY